METIQSLLTDAGVNVPMCCAAVVGISVIIGIAYHIDRKQAAALQEIADTIGFEFSTKEDEELMAKLRRFPLFNRGQRSSRHMGNVMTRTTDNIRIDIFDYHYSIPDRRYEDSNSFDTHSLTVVCFASPALQLPVFSLEPEGSFNRASMPMGCMDIDFVEHSEFSVKFRLSGNDEIEVREFFDQETLDFFSRQKGLYVQTGSGVLIYFQKGQRNPEQIREFLDEAYVTYGAITERLSRASSTLK